MGYRTLRMAELSFRRQRIERDVGISSGEAAGAVYCFMNSIRIESCE